MNSSAYKKATLVLALLSISIASHGGVRLELDFHTSVDGSRCQLKSTDLNADNLQVRAGTCRLSLPATRFEHCSLDRYHIDNDFLNPRGRGTRGCAVKVVEIGDELSWAFDAILSKDPAALLEENLISCHFQCEPFED